MQKSHKHENSKDRQHWAHKKKYFWTKEERRDEVLSSRSENGNLQVVEKEQGMCGRNILPDNSETVGHSLKLWDPVADWSLPAGGKVLKPKLPC